METATRSVFSTHYFFNYVSDKRRRWPRASSLIKKETLVLRYRRVGHRADQFRRVRWPALLSQTLSDLLPN
jgi:hypothetical protein